MMIISHWRSYEKILWTCHDKSAAPDQKRWMWKKKKSNHISRTFEIDSLEDRRWKRRKNIAWILIQGSTKIPDLRVVFDTRVRFHDTATLSSLFFTLSLFTPLLTTFEIICCAKWTWADIGPQGVLELADDTRSRWTWEWEKKKKKIK